MIGVIATVEIEMVAVRDRAAGVFELVVSVFTVHTKWVRHRHHNAQIVTKIWMGRDLLLQA